MSNAPLHINSFLSAINYGLSGSLFLKYKDILGLTNIKTSVLYYPKENAQREIAERRGKNEIEFINFWRTELTPDWTRARTPAARRGVWMPYDTGTDTLAINVKAMPVKISYMIWYWSHDRDKLNQIAERYFFWQQTSPTLDMEYLDQFPLNLQLSFGSLIDESIIEQKYEKGMYFVYRMPLSIDGWIFLADTPINSEIHTIHLTCFDKDEIVRYEEYLSPHEEYDEARALNLKLFDRTIVSEQES